MHIIQVPTHNESLVYAAAELVDNAITVVDQGSPVATVDIEAAAGDSREVVRIMDAQTIVAEILFPPRAYVETGSGEEITLELQPIDTDRIEIRLWPHQPATQSNTEDV